jgi:hypothetical protein
MLAPVSSIAARRRALALAYPIMVLLCAAGRALVSRKS